MKVKKCEQQKEGKPKSDIFLGFIMLKTEKTCTADRIEAHQFNYNPRFIYK